MGLLSSLFGGKKPQRRGPTGEETAIVNATGALNRERQGLTSIANLYGDSLASGRRGARSDYIGAGVGDVQQAVAQAGPATSYNRAVESALNRGRGLTRVALGRSQEFDSQLLRDRIAFTGASQSRKGRGLSALTTAAGITDRYASGMAAIRQSNSASRADLLGGLAGIGAGFARNSQAFNWLPGNKFHRPKNTNVPEGYMDVNVSGSTVGKG